jgi:hypothetical protein
VMALVRVMKTPSRRGKTGADQSAERVTGGGTPRRRRLSLRRDTNAGRMPRPILKRLDSIPKLAELAASFYITFAGESMASRPLAKSKPYIGAEPPSDYLVDCPSLRS